MKGKRKIPRFRRQHSQDKVRVKKVWRKPRGIDSMQYMGKKAKGNHPNVGYRQPCALRGKHPCGLMEVLVCNLNELKGVDAKTQCARISGTVGGKKRAPMEDYANKNKIGLLN